MNSAKKSKLLYITVRADLGGGSFHVDQLIENLGDSFELFCAAPFEGPYGIKWQRKLSNGHFFELKHRSFSISRLFELNSFIKFNGIRLVHSHGKGAGIYSRLLKIINRNLIVVHTFHGFHPYTKNFYGKFYILFERLFGMFTNFFINVSNGERDLCLNYKIVAPNNSKTIYNGIKEIDKTCYDKVELRNKLFIDQNKFIVLSINRLDPHKNVTQILDIALKFKINNDILFVLVGDGEERNSLELKVKQLELKNVLFTGFKENPLEYIIASNIYISTSLGEALSYTLMEAQMIGVPVVASNVMGHNEIISNGFNGFLFDLNDNDKAISLINFVYNNPKSLDKILANGKDRILHSFKLETMVNSIKEIYLNLNR